MKNIFVPLMTVAVVVALVIGGCMPAPAPPVTPPPVTPPPVTPPPVTPPPEQEVFSPETVIAQTKYGPVQGAYMGIAGDIKHPPVYAWIKVPYAKPPVGDLMFRAPQEPESWSKAKDCTEYNITFDDYPLQWDWSYFTGENKVIGTLDCLYLNVWRPQTVETNLPVQVDIHGGSACNWAGLDCNEWQQYVNKANCIVVAPNYRLGPWGFFYNSSLTTGNPEDDSGNFALLDQIKVLEWVKENIAAFGGNPENVTLSGQSSGGLHVALLLHSPLAKDLFQKALISSSAIGYGLEGTIERGQEASEKILVNMLLYDETNNVSTEDEAEQAAQNMSDGEKASYFRDKFTNDPKLIFTSVNNGTPNRPSKSDLFIWGFTDGYVVNSTIDWDPVGNNYFPKPMIIGSTETDMYANYAAQIACGGGELANAHYAFLYGSPLDYATYDEAIAGLVPIVADKNNPKEEERTPGGWFNWSVEDFKAKYKITSDAWLRAYDIFGVQYPARSVATSPDLRGKIYVYRHEWGTGGNGIPFSGLYAFNLGAQHSDDLAFMYDWNDIKGPTWFDTWTREFAFNDDNYAGRKALSDAVGAYLKAFLHSEDGVITKNNDMPIEWKPWAADSEQFITWNATKTEAKLDMNTTEVFTEDTLREYLESSIDNLPEATNEDKTALKVWAANALNESGFSSWYDELQG